MVKLIIGLTGGISTGKSTVSNILLEKSYKLIDADLISKEVAEDSQVLKDLLLVFGDEVIKNKKLNRAYLRKIVFNDKKKLDLLNGIMHPKIIEKIKKEIEANKDERILFLDIPLLFEVKLEYLVDKVLLISCNKELQIERLKKRDNINSELALNMISKQMDLKEKEFLADYIIYNNSTLENLKEEVAIFLEKISLII